MTTGTYNLQSVIVNSAFVGLLIAGAAGKLFAGSPGKAFLVAFEVNTQFLLHFNCKNTSQLIIGKFNDLKKFDIFFKGTTILTFTSNLPVILVL